MSIKLMSRLWDTSRHDGTHLLVLLALADWANEDGEAYPSIDTLARKCRVKRRRCQQIIEELSSKDPDNPNAPEPELVILYQQGRLDKEMRKRIPIEMQNSPNIRPNLFIVRPPDGQPQPRPADRRDEADGPDEPDNLDRPNGSGEGVQFSAPGGMQEIAPEGGAISRAFDVGGGAENCTRSVERGVQEIAPNTSLPPIGSIHPPVRESAAVAAPPPAQAGVQKKSGVPTKRSPKLHSLETAADIMRQHIRDSHHLQGAAFNSDGYIAQGTGTNPVQWYYEWFSIKKPDERLDGRQEDILMDRCPHDERTYTAIEAHKLSGNKRAKNIQLIIQWSNDPSLIYSQSRSTANNASRSNQQPAPAKPAERAPATAPDDDADADDADDAIMAVLAANQRRVREMPPGLAKALQAS